MFIFSIFFSTETFALGTVFWPLWSTIILSFFGAYFGGYIAMYLATSCLLMSWVTAIYCGYLVVMQEQIIVFNLFTAFDIPLQNMWIELPHSLMIFKFTIFVAA